MSRSSLEGSSIGADRALESVGPADQGLCERGAARGGADPEGGLGMAEPGGGAEGRRGGLAGVGVRVGGMIQWGGSGSQSAGGAQTSAAVASSRVWSSAARIA